MKYNIQKWGKLEKKTRVNPYDFGGILSSTLGGAATGSAVPGIGTLIGAGVGLIGGLLGNKREKEAKQLQDQQLAQQQMMQKQQQILAMPQSGGGLPGQFTLGGYLTPELLAKSGIYIKPENKGKFTATKKATGKTTEQLTHSKNPLIRKRAIFAQNAKKWKHADGGYVNSLATDTTGLVTYNAGGKHNQNPLGGIPLSMGSKGKRNSVEQGESSFKFPEGKYIFSNRLKIKK